MAKEFSLTVKPSSFSGDALAKIVQEQFNKAVLDLANQALEYAKAEARNKLHSKQNEYIKSLKMDVDQHGKTSKIKIYLEQSAQWLEDGHKAIDLKEKQLKGRDSIVIPFNHGKTGPLSKMNPTNQTLYSEAKSFLQGQGMKVSRPNFGQQGPLGSFSKVPSTLKSKHTGESYLNRMKLAQEVGPRGGVKNQMTTFRTMSKDQPKDMWVIPAFKGVKILDATKDWLDKNYKSLMKEAMSKKKK